MNRLYYIILALGSTFLAGCKKDKIQLYTDIARIQFGPEPSVYYSSSRVYADTVKSQTFAYLGTNVVVDTVYFDIYTMGLPADTDRNFVIRQEQVPGAINAVPGVHYKAFDNAEVIRYYVIKAGTTHSKVPVILFRDTSLKTNSVALKFSLVENAFFALGQQGLLWRKVVFTDKLIKPTAWSGSRESQFYGAYSEAKHRFMISATGQKWDQDFMAEINKYTERVQYWMGVVKSALAAYNTANATSPIIDEITKQPIVFP